MKGDYCTVGKFFPSSRTVDAISDMNHITEMANLLERIVIVVPFFQVFVGRKTYAFTEMISMGRQVQTSDWLMFSGALKGVSLIQRGQLERIAFQASFYSTGEEKNFGDCVYNAL